MPKEGRGEGQGSEIQPYKIFAFAVVLLLLEPIMFHHIAAEYQTPWEWAFAYSLALLGIVLVGIVIFSIQSPIELALSADEVEKRFD